MKKRFFKKLKKIILTLSCVLSCLVIFTVSVTAEELIHVNLSSVRMVNFSVGTDIETSDFTQHSEGYLYWTSPDYNNTIFNFNGATIRFDYENSYNDIIKSGEYNAYFPVSIFPNYDSNFNINNLGSIDYTVIFPNGGISFSGELSFKKLGNAYVLAIEESFNVSVPSNNLFNDFSIILHFNNTVGTNQSRVHWFGFYGSPSISLSSASLPPSDQPNYSQPSSGSTSELEGVESELVGSTNSAAQEEINKSFNISFDLIQQWAYPISAFRDAFNYFVNSHNAVYTICIITLVIGVFLLFSNFVPRGRDK